ncbi:MAG: hypothetical protein HYX55_01320 [Chloroflexi bacterium]|nr:hypothetical protein [Chloroflexota bacterium]
MAKRTRYGNKPSARPAAKRPGMPSAKPAAPAAGSVRGSSRAAEVIVAHDHDHDHGDMPLRSGAALTEEELKRAAELEAEVTARERAAIAESLRRRSGAQAGAHHRAGDVNAPLSVRMSHEYAYVVRDVKRIALTAGLMVAILAILDILVNVLGVITL